MHMKLKIASASLAAVCACILMYAVSRALFSKTEISGKIMVVQRNAEVRKLALVKVHVVPSEEAHAWRDSVSERCRRILEQSARCRENSESEKMALALDYDTRIRRLESLLGSATEIRDAAREFWLVDPNQPTKKRRFFEVVARDGMPSSKDVEQHAMAAKWDRCYEVLRNGVVPELELSLSSLKDRKDRELRRMDDELKKDLSELRRRFDEATSYDGLTEIPGHLKVAGTVVSDDNGEFSINVPPGDYYLVARGARTVFDKEERYYWAKKVTVPSDESERCLMGNHSMLDGEEPSLWNGLQELIRNYSAQK